MPSMPILDVAIGLSLYYLLLGLVCTTVNEMTAAFFNTRSVYLMRGIDRLLGNDSELRKKLLSHPLIRSLAENDGKLPSYIPSAGFAIALLDILSGAGKPHTDTAAVLEGAKVNPSLLEAMTALAHAAQERGVELKTEVAEWFDHAMDRVSGWYKRHTQIKSLAVAAIITLALNVNTIAVGTTLWTNPTVRAAVVDAAQARVAQSAPSELPLVEYNNPDDATASTPIMAGTSQGPILSQDEQDLLGKVGGWSGEKFENSAIWWWQHLAGWIMTILAVSLGAPFWFDTLQHFVNVRNAGKAPADSRPRTGGKAAQPEEA